MNLSAAQQEALERAQKHGGRLIRWRRGGYWTYEAAIPRTGNRFGSPSILEWYCTTNTIFALVRRGYMVMDDWEHCSLAKKKTNQKDASAVKV